MKFLDKAKIWGPFWLGVLALVAFALPQYRQGEASLAGKTPEDFTMQLNGKAIKLSDLHGKIVVLNFWASWCPPCLGEIPNWLEMVEEFKGKPIQLLAVSLEGSVG